MAKINFTVTFYVPSQNGGDIPRFEVLSRWDKNKVDVLVAPSGPDDLDLIETRSETSPLLVSLGILQPVDKSMNIYRLKRKFVKSVKIYKQDRMYDWCETFRRGRYKADVAIELPAKKFPRHNATHDEEPLSRPQYCIHCGKRIKRRYLSAPYWCLECSQWSMLLSGMDLENQAIQEVRTPVTSVDNRLAELTAARTKHLVTEAARSGNYQSADQMQKRGLIAEFLQRLR